MVVAEGLARVGIHPLLLLLLAQRVHQCVVDGDLREVLQRARQGGILQSVGLLCIEKHVVDGDLKEVLRQVGQPSRGVVRTAVSWALLCQIVCV